MDKNYYFTVLKNHTSSSAQTGITARYDVGTFLMHTERKAA